MIHKENINTKHLLGLTMLPYTALRGGEVHVHTHTQFPYSQQQALA